MFVSLLNKSFKFWLRAPVASSLEIFLPLLVISIMAGIRHHLSEVVTPKQPYNQRTFLNTFDNNANAEIDELLFFKNCSSISRKGGRVVLSPVNPITVQLDNVFSKLGYETVFFENQVKIDEFIAQSNYIEPFENGTMRQFCFGVVFEQGMAPSAYNYSLLFNNSNPNSKDYYELDDGSKVSSIADSSDIFEKLVFNGVMATKLLVDSLIVKKETGENSVIGIQRMQALTNYFVNISDFEVGFMIAFAIAGIIPFLRIIAVIVGERENKATESLVRVGMNRFSYLSSIFIFTFFQQVIVALLFTLILKFGLFTKTNFFILLLFDVLFILTLMAFSFLISTFFKTTKTAVIAGILIYILFMILWLLKDNIVVSGEAAGVILGISPLGNIAQMIKAFIVFESNEVAYTVDSFSRKVYNFRGTTSIVISLVEICVFLLLAVYFSYVLPIATKNPLHPLLCVKRKRKPLLLPAALTVGHPLPTRNIEPEEAENRGMAGRGESLSVKNLTKLYGEKAAVDDLSLEIFSGQILVLLGHNGAGKTTLLSMISGSKVQTAGSISIFGRDTIEEEIEAQKLLGVCPQGSPIFPKLTVWEHVALYAAARGLKNPEGEVEGLLEDLDLLRKKDRPCGRLSGGERRKLCTALAFVGGSKVILLDEPTSDMDSLSRRQVWDMLKRNKAGRVFVITTHDMEEAEFLGDKIGILREGALHSFGSPGFLKRKFNVGYVLTLTRATRSHVDFRKTVDFVCARLETAEPLSPTTQEIRFRLPIDSVPEFAPLLAALEENLGQLGLADMGLSITTLEDVFRQVEQPGPAPKTLNTQTLYPSTARPLNPSILDPSTTHPHIPITPDISTLDPPEEDHFLVSGRGLKRLQLRGLITKKILTARRDFWVPVLEIGAPILLAIIAFALLKINFSGQPHSYNLSLSLLGKGEMFLNDFSRNFGRGNISTSSLVESLGKDWSGRSLGVINSQKFDQEIFDRRSEEQALALYFDKESRVANFTVFVNSTAPFSGLVGASVASNALLGVVGASISSQLRGFRETEGVSKISGAVDGLIVALFLAVGFSFVSSSIIGELIREESSGLKRQLLLAGLGKFRYWLGHFIVDLPKVLLLSAATFGLALAFGVEFFYEQNNWAMTIPLLGINSWNVVFFAYLASRFFVRPFNGQIFVFVYCFVGNYFFVALIFALKTTASGRSFAHSTLQNIFRAAPHFGFINGLFNLASFPLFRLIMRWPDYNHPFHTNGALPDLLACAGHAIFIPLALAAIESRSRILAIFQKLGRAPQAKPVESGREQEILSSRNPEESEDDRPVAVKLENVSKVFRRGCGRGKNIEAVRGISMSVKTGEVFGLLGTNGAGKSSTFKMMTGELRPDRGEILVKGFRIPEELNSAKRQIGYCPQSNPLCERLTVREHLELFARVRGIRPGLETQIVEEIADRLGLAIQLDDPAIKVSGGSKRKICLAAALVTRPSVVFLDEPGSGMDPISRAQMWKELADIAARNVGSTIVITTHSMQEAEALASNIAILDEGKIAVVGPPHEIKQKLGAGPELHIRFDPQIIPSSNTTQALNVLAGIPLSTNPSAQNTQLINHLTQSPLPSNPSALLFSSACQKVENVLSPNFKTTLLENWGRNATFQIEKNTPLSKIFEVLEKAKNELGLEDYAVRQASLEQIFVKIASKSLKLVS